VRAEAQKPQAPPPSRMSLAAVSKGNTNQPLRVLLYGTDGVGKTTFGVSAPKSVFITSESGLVNFPHHPRFPAPESWAEIHDAIRALTNDPHEYQTLVIDSLDWAEPLCWRYLCEQDGVKSIELVAKGYGKGYLAAVDEWRGLLAALERLSAKRGMHIVLLAHSQVKPFKNPTGDDYDRYQIKLNDKAAGLIREWCDAVLFANHEVGLKTDDRTKRVKGVTTKSRLIYTTHAATWEAKNRYNLPEELPLSWDEFFDAVQAGRVAEPSVMRAEIERKAKEIGGEIEVQALATMAKFGDDTAKLATLNNKLNAKLTEKEASNG
jgi:hypothetical protein